MGLGWNHKHTGAPQSYNRAWTCSLCSLKQVAECMVQVCSVFPLCTKYMYLHVKIRVNLLCSMNDMAGYVLCPIVIIHVHVRFLCCYVCAGIVSCCWAWHPLQCRDWPQPAFMAHRFPRGDRHSQGTCTGTCTWLNTCTCTLKRFFCMPGLLTSLERLQSIGDITDSVATCRSFNQNDAL